MTTGEASLPRGAPGSVDLWLLGEIGALLAVAGFVSALGIGLSRGGFLRGVIERHERGFARDLAFVGSPLKAPVIIACQGVTVVLVLAAPLLLGVSPVVLALVVPVLVCPRIAARRASVVRSERIEAQLDRWLLALASALSATGALGDALVTSVRAVQPPLAEELERVVREHQLGAPLDQSLEAMSARARSRLVRGAVATLTIARNLGGDPRITLESAAASLREMARLEGVVRARTAEGKAQALVVSIVPAPLVGAVHFMAPEFFAPLGRSLPGALVVAAAALLWLGAIALAVNITAVDV